MTDWIECQSSEKSLGFRRRALLIARIGELRNYRETLFQSTGESEKVKAAIAGVESRIDLYLEEFAGLVMDLLKLDQAGTTR